MPRPDPELLRRVERLLGSRVESARAVAGGYTPAQRWVVELSNGRSAFAKCASQSLTAAWLREEQRLYASLRAPFVPELLGFEDHESEPLLCIENLCGADWPPPWDAARVEAVLATFDELHARSWDGPTFAERHPGGLRGWSVVAEDPGPFLGLGFADEGWLERALPVLLEHEQRVEQSGDSLTHFDLRSDNLCLRDGRALLVDWSGACVGNPELDTAFFLPSLHAEGGPPPEQVLPHAAPSAALVSGFFAKCAGLPAIPDAPRVRRVQLEQLETALPWAIRALDLPELPAALSARRAPPPR